LRIRETNLNFTRTPANRSSTAKYIIHHSYSGDVSAQTIHGWHLARGWLGIGYHFVIRHNGNIERGRAERTIGAHARGHNNDSIGICLTGNFMINVPSKAQLESLVWLLKDYLFPRYGELPVGGHEDYQATLCPGAKFPWDTFRTMMEGEEEMAERVILLNSEHPMNDMNGGIVWLSQRLKAPVYFKGTPVKAKRTYVVGGSTDKSDIAGEPGEIVPISGETRAQTLVALGKFLEEV